MMFENERVETLRIQSIINKRVSRFIKKHRWKWKQNEWNGHLFIDLLISKSLSKIDFTNPSVIMREYMHKIISTNDSKYGIRYGYVIGWNVNVLMGR